MRTVATHELVVFMATLLNYQIAVERFVHHEARGSQATNIALVHPCS